VNFDLACVALVAVLALWGAWRGLVRQIFSIAGFVGGIVLSRLFAGSFGRTYAKDLNLPVGVAIAAAAIVLFLLAGVAASILAMLVRSVVKGGFTGMIDRLGGLALGFAKGVLAAWAVASIVAAVLPHLPKGGKDSLTTKVDLQHSRVIAAANDTNLITELEKGEPGRRAMR
jgi:membrane protein required for colicin V production